MELLWGMAFKCYLTIEMIAMGYILCRFAKPFLRNKKGAAWAGATYSATMLLLYFIPLEFHNFAAYSIGVLAAFAVLCRMDRRNYQQKVFIAVTFFSLRWLSGYVMNMLTKTTYWQLLNLPYMVGRPKLQLAFYIAAEALDAGVNLTILGVSAGYIGKAYVYKQENMSTKEMLMLILPSVTGLAGYGIMQYYQYFFHMSAVEAVSGIYGGLAALYFGVSILTIVVVAVLFQNIKARQKEKLSAELLAAQVDSVRQHIEQAEASYQSLRAFRHDMASHILTLEMLYAGDKAEEAKAYGAELKAILSQMSGEIKSGNPVTDVILQEMKNKAENRGISFRSDFWYPEGSKVNAFDISVILHNALNNAMENIGDSQMAGKCQDVGDGQMAGKCQAAGNGETPYILVRSYHRNNAYMVEIRNSFTGSLQWDAESGLPVTTKEQADGHGYGLANIRRVAEKYSGEIAIDLEEGEFCLSVLLMLE